MKTKPDLNELAKVVFEANKTKGLHDNDISNETLLMLVITELSEAVEADRKGKRFSLEKYEYETMTECQGWLTSDEKFKNVFESQVKDTLEDELADTVIRLLDLAGLRKVIVNIECVHKLLVRTYELKSFTEYIYLLSRMITKHLHPQNKNLKDVIDVGIAEIEGLCEYLNIDLWLHVELKLKYNTTRSYKHNKNY